MATERKTKRLGLSRRRLILSGAIGVLALVNGAVLAKRHGWTDRIGALRAAWGKRIEKLLAHFQPTPSVELRFAGPFENDKPLLEKPLENEWVCVERAYSQTRSYSPKTKDVIQVLFAFRGEKTKERPKRLTDPYKIAFAVVVEDKQGTHHPVVDRMVNYDPETYEFKVGGGFTVGGGEGSYGGVYELPIKLKDVAVICVRLSKIGL